MERDWLNVGWKMLLVRGVIAVLFGIVAIAWPISTAIALALLWGFWALFDGIGSLVQAFQPESRGGRVWLVIMGLIALVAAFFAIFSPAVTAVALTWILGIWLIVRGVFEAIGAFSSSSQLPRWLLLVGAALSLILGLLFVFNPGRAVVAIAVWLGVAAIIWGGVFVAMAIAIRHDLTSLEHPAPGDHPLTT
ncbi:MAG: hypothetical protein QOH50_3377 [Kribbellaceae bacterium]|nr:hypothetical protein [Kribbellaceae bacterium]